MLHRIIAIGDWFATADRLRSLMYLQIVLPGKNRLICNSLLRLLCLLGVCYPFSALAQPIELKTLSIEQVRSMFPRAWEWEQERRRREQQAGYTISHGILSYCSNYGRTVENYTIRSDRRRHWRCLRLNGCTPSQSAEGNTCPALDERIVIYFTELSLREEDRIRRDCSLRLASGTEISFCNEVPTAGIDTPLWYELFDQDGQSRQATEIKKRLEELKEFIASQRTSAAPPSVPRLATPTPAPAPAPAAVPRSRAYPSSCIGLSYQQTSASARSSNWSHSVTFTNNCGACVKFGVLLRLNDRDHGQLGVVRLEIGASSRESYPFSWDPGASLVAHARANDVQSCN